MGARGTSAAAPTAETAVETMILQPQPIDLLVEGDFLIPMTDRTPVVRGGEVAVRGNRIVHSGPARPTGWWDAKRTIRARGHAILPGFVNVHCHTASIVFRSQTDDPPGGIMLYSIGFRISPGSGGSEPRGWRCGSRPRSELILRGRRSTEQPERHAAATIEEDR